MALQKKNSSSSRFVVIGIIVVIVGVAGFFLFQQFYLNSTGTEAINSTTDRTNRVIRTFGEDILQDPRYQGLEQYGTEPIEPAGTNPNPFQ
jgi:hypothetical protein